MRNLTSIVFEDGLCGLPWWGVKKYNRCNILPEWFSNAGNLLCQDPRADAVMAGTKAKLDQLASAAFHVFRSGTVIENKECVCLLKEVAGQF